LDLTLLVPDRTQRVEIQDRADGVQRTAEGRDEVGLPAVLLSADEGESDDGRRGSTVSVTR
jgi:hypothetical protein